MKKDNIRTIKNDFYQLYDKIKTEGKPNFYLKEIYNYLANYNDLELISEQINLIKIQF